jgi:adenosine kinase
MEKYVEFAVANNKPLGYNLSAPFLIQFFTEKVNNILQFADFVFCNEHEA